MAFTAKEIFGELPFTARRLNPSDSHFVLFLFIVIECGELAAWPVVASSILRANYRVSDSVDFLAPTFGQSANDDRYTLHE